MTFFKAAPVLLAAAVLVALVQAAPQPLTSLVDAAGVTQVEHPQHTLVKRESSTPSVCRHNAVCGWEVYDSHTRDLEYYVSSSCKCSSEEACLRVDDDISITAYVYRCRPRRTKSRGTKSAPRPASQNSTS